MALGIKIIRYKEWKRGITLLNRWIDYWIGYDDDNERYVDDGKQLLNDTMEYLKARRQLWR